MAVSDRWHFSDRDAAEKAGVTTKCRCGGRKPLYPTADHERGKRWRVRNRVDGKQVTTSFAGKTEADAFDLGQRNQLRQGITPIDRSAGQMLFKVYAAAVLALRLYEPSSLSTNKGYLKNHLNPFLGDLPLSAIKPSTIEGWKKWMHSRICARTKRPYSATLIEAVYILLSTILKSAVFDEKIPTNPCRNVSYPKPPQAPEVKVWEGAVVDKLLANVHDAHHTLLLLAAHCGHRQGEAFAVSFEDMHGDEIDIVHQVVRRPDGRLGLMPPKHNSARRAPLPREVADAMRLHVKRYPVITMECACPRADHWGKTWRILFHDQLPDYMTGPRSRPRGRPLLPAQWNKRIWHPTLRAVDIDPANADKTGLHMLRHYCASTWLAGGAPVLDVSRWLGHKSITVTEKVYGHLFNHSAERGRQIMADVFAERRNRAGLAVVSNG